MLDERTHESTRPMRASSLVASYGAECEVVTMTWSKE